MKKSIFKKIFWPIVYTVMSIVLCVVACYSFKSVYFESVFVDGNSMSPTLKGEIGVDFGAHFGFTDKSKKAINGLKRFDVITTYYPFVESDYPQPYVKGDKYLKTATYKIKRVIALPGETFKIIGNQLFLKQDGNWSDIIPFEKNDKEITRAFSQDWTRSVPETTLKEDEYWVMGDNWSNTNGGSYDCASQRAGGFLNGPIYKENIVGKLIAIEGECTIVHDASGKYNCLAKKYYKERMYV